MLTAAKTYMTKTPELVSIPIVDVTPLFLSEYGVELLGPKTKLFFDYDKKFDTEEESKAHHKEVRNTILSYTSYRHPIVMTESIQPCKVSFHVIFYKDTIVRDGFYPEDEKELFSKVVGEENFKNIDESVYGKKKWFRLPYGTLQGKPYQHIPFVNVGDTLPHMSHFVMTVPEDTECNEYSLCPARINRQFAQLMREQESEEDDHEEDTLINVDTILSKLNPERFKEMKPWYVLATITKCYSNVKTFCELSESSGYSNYNPKTCKMTWEKAPECTHLGMLRKWMKEDGMDVQMYFPIRSPLLKDLIHIITNKEGGLSDFNIGNTLKKVYGDKLFYCSLGWLHWNQEKHMWSHGDDSSIFQPIMKLLTLELFAYIKEMTMKATTTITDANELKTSLMVWKALSSEVTKLQSVKRIKDVLTYCKGIFLDEGLLNRFDTQAHLFSFQNGITYNLRTKEVRPIEKTDYILTTCGYDYPARVEADVANVTAFMATLFEPSQLDFSLSCLSTFVYGENINEIFLIMKGRGRNGKGATDTLLRVALGTYHQTLPSEELTEDSKGKGRANSSLANARFARCLMTSEPDNKQKMKSDRIKLLTGRDPITTRQLFGKEFVYSAQFTLAVQCNDLPEYSHVDDAIVQRAVYLDYPFQFVENVIRDYQRPIDVTLKDKLRQDVTYRNGFLHLLFDTWFKNTGKVIRTIESKAIAQEEFDNNNPLSKFLENYETSVGFIRIQELRTLYNNEYENLTAPKFKKLLMMTKIKVTEDKVHGMKVYISKVR